MCDDDLSEVSIFCVQTLSAWAPFSDSSRVETHELGYYTSPNAALAWIRGKEFGNTSALRLLYGP